MIRLMKILILTAIIVIGGFHNEAVTEAANQVMSDTITVRMDGVAPSGQLNNAIEASKKRAVFKILSHMTRPDQDPNSIFAQIMTRYNDYVLQCNIIKKNEGVQLQVISDVQVDGKKLKDDFSNGTFDKQSDNRRMVAKLIVRTVNVHNPDFMDEKAMTDYNNCFTGLGFKTNFSGEVLQKIKSIRHLPYQAFEQEVFKSISNHELMVRFGVIGEIRLVSVENNPTGNGYCAKAEVFLKSVDMKNKCIVGEFSDNYVMLGNDKEEAERLAIQKASIDSAESMAQQTLKYWRGLK